MSILRVKNINKSIKGEDIINDISMCIKNGEIVGLLGPNGAGKTTMFYITCGLIEASSGRVYIDNKDISKVPLYKRVKLGIRYLPQEPTIFKDLTVEENMLLAIDVAYKNRKEAQKRLEYLLELLNIEPIRYKKGVSLSGGERRRCEIARSLSVIPKFLLFDEPFAGIDPISVLDIQRILKELKLLDIGILITDHNVRETLSICDRAYVIKNGNILAHGSSDDIYENELVKMHYLGENFRI